LFFHWDLQIADTLLDPYALDTVKHTVGPLNQIRLLQNQLYQHGDKRDKKKSKNK